MENYIQDLKRHLADTSGEWKFESDNEISFAIGQAVAVMGADIKKFRRESTSINPFIQEENAAKIIKRLKNRYVEFNKYQNTQPSTYNTDQLNAILSHVFKLTPDDYNPDVCIIAAGYLENIMLDRK